MKFDSNGIAASNSFLSSIALEVLDPLSVKNAPAVVHVPMQILTMQLMELGTSLTATDTLISLS